MMFFDPEHRLFKILEEAISQTKGLGVSSTKIVWLSNGMLACYCATLTTFGGVGVYVFLQIADPVYWSSVAALWTISIGFAQRVKNMQTKASKEIAIAAEENRPEEKC